MTVVPGKSNRWCQTVSVRHHCQIPTKKTVKFVGICDKKRDSDEKDVEFRRNM